jgi:uncharacterized protein YjiS (DUF1127 family)
MNTPTYYGSVGVMTAPAMPGHRGLAAFGRRLTYALHEIVTTFYVWHARSHSRWRLARLEDCRLDDLGLTRAAVRREVAKPFWRA